MALLMFQLSVRCAQPIPPSRPRSFCPHLHERLQARGAALRPVLLQVGLVRQVLRAEQVHGQQQAREARGEEAQEAAGERAQHGLWPGQGRGQWRGEEGDVRRRKRVTGSRAVQGSGWVAG